ncbi:hypothetical protein ACHZ98_17540 [Streptomyces sp. MAR4 CNY-716]
MTAVVGFLDAEHLTVLDGRTLNVCVRLPEGGARRSGAWLRVGDRALRLEAAGERAFGTYVVEPVAGGTPGGRGWRGRWPGPERRKGAAAGHGLEVIAVGEGEVRELGVAVALEGRRGREEYGLRAPGAVAHGAVAEHRAGAAAGASGGPTRLDPPHPDGWRITVAPPREGGVAALRADRLPPHAEVDRVALGWTELAIHGRVVGPGAPAAQRRPGDPPARRRSGRAAGEASPGSSGPAPGGEFACELVGRGAACALRVAGCRDGRFVAVLGGWELARLAEWGGERTWDLRVRAWGCAMPVGRLLGDVVDPGRVHRLPNRLLIADSGDVLRVAPRYTAAGRLVVVTEVVGETR